MMNGKAGGNIAAALAQAAHDNQVRVQSLSLFLGLSGVALQLLGIKLVRCTCMRPECSGHAIQFDNRAHFTPRGIEMIPRGDAAKEEEAHAGDLAVVKGT